MKKYALISLLTTISIISCTGQPYQDVDIKSISDEQLLSGKKSIKFGSISKRNKPQTIYVTPPKIAPIERRKNMMTFDQWKEAKEINSKEYQNFIEYRDYIRFLEIHEK